MEGEGFEHGISTIPFQSNEKAKLRHAIVDYFILKMFATRIIFSEFTEFRCCWVNYKIILKLWLNHSAIPTF